MCMRVRVEYSIAGGEQTNGAPRRKGARLRRNSWSKLSGTKDICSLVFTLVDDATTFMSGSQDASVLSRSANSSCRRSGPAIDMKQEEGPGLNTNTAVHGVKT